MTSDAANHPPAGDTRTGDGAISLTVNGEPRRLAGPATGAAPSVADLLSALDLEPRKIAVERNLEIVPRSLYDETRLSDGDRVEIVHFIGGGDGRDTGAGAREGASAGADDDPLVIAGRTYRSRLIIGTGKYKDYAENAAALEASGAEIVTVAVRRVNLTDRSQPMLVDHIDPAKVTFLPNTAGCFTGEDAVRTLRLAREAGGWDLVKLEVLGDQKTLYPNMRETFRAAEMLLADGFEVMVYCNDDPIAAKELEDMGCCAIMPLGGLIGSGLGVLNPVNIRLIVEQARVPVLVDAGVGTASDAAIAMELGCDAVLLNTAIAEAKDPLRMARAMRHAVVAGREAYLAGRMPKKKYADPSSPLAGLI